MRRNIIIICPVLFALVHLSVLVGCREPAPIKETQVATQGACTVSASVQGAATTITLTHKDGLSETLQFVDGTLQPLPTHKAIVGDPGLEQRGPKLCATGKVEEGGVCVLIWWGAGSCLDGGGASDAQP